VFWVLEDMRYFYVILLFIIGGLSVFTFLMVDDNASQKQTALAQAKNIELHYFQLDTLVKCSDNFPNRGIATFKIRTELNSNNSPVQTELGYTYRQHYAGAKHGEPIDRIVASHLHRPSSILPFAELEATIEIPTHKNNDHEEVITFFINAVDIATEEKFRYVNEQSVPTCIIPFAESSSTIQ
jgi:hypothetical protein